jgi:hypothetical protein
MLSRLARIRSPRRFRRQLSAASPVAGPHELTVGVRCPWSRATALQKGRRSKLQEDGRRARGGVAHHRRCRNRSPRKAVADLAENTLQRLTRVLGGGTLNVPCDRGMGRGCGTIVSLGAMRHKKEPRWLPPARTLAIQAASAEPPVKVAVWRSS